MYFYPLIVTIFMPYAFDNEMIFTIIDYQMNYNNVCIAKKNPFQMTHAHMTHYWKLC